MSKLNDRQIHTWSMHWPSGGSWRADLILTDGDIVAAGEAATIKAESLTLVGRVLRSGLDAADRPHLTVIGGLGWQSLLPAPVSFQSDAGVRLRTVLRTLAGYADEPIELPTDDSIGSYYELSRSRVGDPVRLADCLNDLVRHGLCPQWRVDPDGVTRFGSRTAIEVNTRATSLANNKGVGVSTYGLDDPKQFQPGNTLDGTTIDRLDLRETDGKFEADVFTSLSAAPLREQIRRMVAAELAEFGDQCRTYEVVTCHADGRCDLRPPPDAPHLPEMQNVEQWIMGGATFFAEAGDEAVVVFRDTKRTRPVIVGFKRLSGSAASSFPRMARVGDVVQSGGRGATINFSSAAGSPVFLCDFSSGSAQPVPGPYLVSYGTITSLGPVPPTPLMASPLYGAITSGTHILGAKTQ